MKYNIVIPTCKKGNEAELIRLAMDAVNTSSAVNIFASCHPASAATNRNYCLMRCTEEYIVMIDDDISGFTPGWADSLVKMLDTCKDVVMVSARLMHDSDNNIPAIMMDIEPDLSRPVQIVKQKRLPTPCVAFRNDGTRFDERYIGSGWEDTDFCAQLEKRYPEGIFCINNSVKIVHQNEMKNGNAGNFMLNRELYLSKWGAV